MERAEAVARAEIMTETRHSPETAERPAVGSELGTVAGIPNWPATWPLPQYRGPLAPFDLRTHILGDLGRRIAALLPVTEHGAAPEAERARAEVQTIAAVLRPLCRRAADTLERMALGGRWRDCGGVAAMLHEARDRELSGSMPERWRLATGPALPVDDLWPLLAPRHRLHDLASWLHTCAPERQDEARQAVRLHVEALEPAEVAVERLGVPVDEHGRPASRS